MLAKFSLTNFCERFRSLLFFLSLFASQEALHAQTPAASIDGQSSFTAKLINIEAATNETFRYNTTLHNGAGKATVFEFKTNLPIGWVISYKVDGNQVTSLNMDPGSTRDVSIEVNASATTTPGKYKLPVKAIVNADTLSLNLEAVVKGSYGITLTTPSGKLSEELTSGSHKEIHLEVKNSGTLPLNDIDFSSQLPTNWEATFEPSKIKQLEPGKTLAITAKLKVPDKTIAGDYAATFTATNSNGNSQAAFRMVVTTSLLSGWIGILVILLAVALVYYLIRKYGRR
ncbi:NPCBM-associated, NEW3 domain of alpha-galactosidase [Pedobacter sp. ok626]|uniref:COG1470 family protein n=1 Tax=Pedobacter sp. ok626 TaxID=1761882 RepID=UPI000884BEE0|nr:NEW3 domain-containing protein [Pedobacter sp. ok626]SDI99245.1 NPCBM-associated, NEW3 domain of alpha-galactosidase [Pedobacter sp. ok626]